MKTILIFICLITLMGCGPSTNERVHDGKAEHYISMDHDKGVILTLNPDKTFDITNTGKDTIRGTWTENIKLLTLTTTDNNTIVYELSATPLKIGDDEISVLTYAFKASSKNNFATGIDLLEKEQTDNFLASAGRYISTGAIESDNSVTLPIGNLAGKVYHYGPDFDNLECVALGECDCCTSSLLFINDSVFVGIDYCIGNDTYFKGTYAINDNTINFHCDSIRVDKETNWEAEADTLDRDLPLYFIKIRQAEPYDFTWTRFDCKGNICFNMDIEATTYAAPATWGKTEFVNETEKDSILIKLRLFP